MKCLAPILTLLAAGLVGCESTPGLSRELNNCEVNVPPSGDRVGSVTLEPDMGEASIAFNIRLDKNAQVMVGGAQSSAIALTEAGGPYQVLYTALDEAESSVAVYRLDSSGNAIETLLAPTQAAKVGLFDTGRAVPTAASVTPVQATESGGASHRITGSASGVTLEFTLAEQANS